ncbi:hypothetical protein J6590_056882 [Homalodisca vitripennis]|nr:hypothetical protein J6590_056882 [Homalodisca vitripennis]
MRTNGVKVTLEPPPMTGQAGCLQEQIALRSPIQAAAIRFVVGTFQLHCVMYRALAGISTREQLDRLSQDNQIKERRAWLLLGWVTAERSCSCKRFACVVIGGGSDDEGCLTPDGFYALDTTEYYLTHTQTSIQGMDINIVLLYSINKRKQWGDPINIKK